MDYIAHAEKNKLNKHYTKMEPEGRGKNGDHNNQADGGDVAEKKGTEMETADLCVHVHTVLMYSGHC